MKRQKRFIRSFICTLLIIALAFPVFPVFPLVYGEELKKIERVESGSEPEPGVLSEKDLEQLGFGADVRETMKPTDIYNSPENPLTGTRPSGVSITLLEYSELEYSSRDSDSFQNGILDIDNDSYGKTRGLSGNDGGGLIVGAQKIYNNRDNPGNISALNQTAMRVVKNGKRDYTAKVYVKDNNLYLSVGPSKAVSYYNEMKIGEHLNYKDLYEWETQPFLQLTAGDFDGDGIDELAVVSAELYFDGVTPVINIYSVSSVSGNSVKLNRRKQIFMYDINPYYISKKGVSKSKESSDRGGRDRLKDFTGVQLTAFDPTNSGKDFLAVTTNFNNRTDDSMKKQRNYSTFYLLKDPLNGYSFEYDQQLLLSFASSYYEDANYHDEQMRYASTAFGDINGDGVKELVICGRKNGRTKRGDSPDWSIDDKYNILTYLNYNEATKRMQYEEGVGFYYLARNKYANCTTSNDIHNPMGLALFKYNGYADKDYIFANGCIYEFVDSPANIILPSYATKNTLSNSFKKVEDCIWGVVAISARTWFGSVVSGNFSKDDDGREQVIYIAATSYGSGENSSMYVISCKKGVDGKPVYNKSELTRMAHRAQYYCALNTTDTDDDSLLARYKGEKKYSYSAPQIMAVLQSAPYFNELKAYGLNPSEYFTKFGNTESKTEDSSSGFNLTETLSFGGMWGGISAKIALGGGIGYTYGDSHTEAFTLTKFAQGRDAVSLVMIPYVDYFYETWCPPFTVIDEKTYKEYTQKYEEGMAKLEEMAKQPDYSKGSAAKTELLNELVFYQDEIKAADGYIELGYSFGQKVTKGQWVDAVMRIPGEPKDTIMTVDAYDRAAAKSDVLTPIRGNVIHSVQGDPFSYVEDSKIPFVAPDKPQNAAPGPNTSMEIVFTTANAHSENIRWSANLALELGKSFGGNGKVVPSFSVGSGTSVSYSGTYATVQSSGSSYISVVKGVPEEAKDDYDLTWSFGYWDGKIEGQEQGFPIIGYRVGSIKAPDVSPPKEVWTDGVTSDSVVLKWTEGTRPADTYYVYMKSSNDLELLGSVEASAADGSGVFSFVIGGENFSLVPDTNYEFTIKGKKGADLSPPYFPYASAHTNRRNVGEAPIFISQPGGNSPYVLAEWGENLEIPVEVQPVKSSPGVTVGELVYQWKKRVGNGSWINVDPAANPTAQTNTLVIDRNDVNDDLEGIQYRCEARQSVNGSLNIGYSEFTTVTLDEDVFNNMLSTRSAVPILPAGINAIDMGGEISLGKDEIAEYAKGGALILKADSGVFLIGEEELAAIAEKTQNTFTLKCAEVESVGVEIKELSKTEELKNMTFAIETTIDGQEYVPENIRFFVPYSTGTSEAGMVLWDIKALNVWGEETVGGRKNMDIIPTNYTEYPFAVQDQTLLPSYLFFSLYRNGAYMVLSPEQSDAIKDANGIEELKTLFRDLAGHWAEQKLQALIDGGAFRNWIQSNMEPDDYITTGTLALLLKWYSGDPYNSGNLGSIQYIDSFNALEALKWAREHGLIYGRDSDLSVTQPVSREQLVTILDRLFAKKGIVLPQLAEPEISDMYAVSPWAYDSVYRFAAARLIVGDGFGYFYPQNLITFGEFASIIDNIKMQLNQPAPFPVMPVEEPLPPSDEDVIPPEEIVPLDEDVVPPEETVPPEEESVQPDENALPPESAPTDENGGGTTPEEAPPSNEGNSPDGGGSTPLNVISPAA